MLETFRKHHYILMCLVAIAVVIAFTFISNPWDSRSGPAGSSQRVGTIYGRDFTLGEVRMIAQLRDMAGQLAAMAQDREGTDPVAQFLNAISSLVNTMSPTDRSQVDLDYPINILVLREECEKLGIEVEREDLEKFIKALGAFRTNGAFDSSKLETFLTSGGMFGDRSATETKLFTMLRDVMLFERVAELVGGTYAPSQAEIDADYARQHQMTVAATALVEKKAHENQTITDEEIQKRYDEEKARKETVPGPEEKTPAPAPDAMVLSDEKRTVKYFVTEAPKPPPAPPPLPPAPTAPPPQGDLSALPEDQKKTKEEEYKKLQDEYKAKLDEHNKAKAEYDKKMEEYRAKVKEAQDAKQPWLGKVKALTDAIVSEERGGKSFEDLARESGFEVKTATFTKSAAPEEVKKISASEGDAAGIIFSAKSHDTETWIEGPGQSAYCFFQVTEVQSSSMLPFEEVKQKLADKLKAEKVTDSLKVAADDARSKLLEGIKAGKSFKDAAAAAMLTAAELPPFSKEKPLPAGTPNTSVVTTEVESLNVGDLSEPKNVPEGLLFIYVERKELPKHPEMEDRKKALAQKRTFRGALAKLPQPDFSQPNAFQEYMDSRQYFEERFGGLTNPVLRAWFGARRSDALAVSP
jgi:SurA N-terminal domain